MSPLLDKTKTRSGLYVSPCLPFLFWTAFQQCLSHRCASYLPVPLCLHQQHNDTYNQTTRPMKAREEKAAACMVLTSSRPCRRTSSSSGQEGRRQRHSWPSSCACSSFSCSPACKTAQCRSPWRMRRRRRSEAKGRAGRLRHNAFSPW